MTPSSARTAPTTYAAVMADIRSGRARGNGARSVPKRSKYGNHRCEIEVDGRLERFDSKAERDRYLMLRILERAGAISDLRRQQTIPLVVDGLIVARMRWDFVYREKGVFVADDYKGAPATADWLLKARLYQALHRGVECRMNGVRMPDLKEAA